VRIRDVETIILRPGRAEQVADSSQDAVIVLVHTDEGLIGVGEADSSPEVVRAVIEAPSSSSLACGLRQLVVGEDPLQPTRLWDRMYRGSIFFGRRGAAIQAMSAIDIALWDITAQAADKPLYELLGGAKRDRISCYASVLMPDTPEAARERACTIADSGFAAAKFGWGPLGCDAALDVELASAARAGLGEDAELMIDVGFAWADAETAIARADAIRASRPTWIEEPLPPDDLAGYAQLAEAIDIPLAAGEEETTHWPFEDLIERGKVKVVQPDVTRVGGVTEIRKIFSLAEERRVRCVPHAWSSTITQLATAHVLLAADVETPLEFQFSGPSFVAELCGNPLVLEGGTVSISARPGLGIELDDDRLNHVRRAQRAAA
jgi:L-rhamnonate dehydratase